MSHNIPPGHIMTRSDDHTVLALTEKTRGTHSPSLSTRGEEILIWAQNRGWTPTATHITGSANVLVDLLSHADKVIQTEWIYHTKLSSRCSKSGKSQACTCLQQNPHRDSMYVSNIVPSSASSRHHKHVTHRTAFLRHPSMVDSMQDRRKSQEREANLDLIVPFCPQNPSYRLFSASFTNPIYVLIKNEYLLQPISGIRHGDVAALNLHAWNLFRSLCTREGCQKEQ